MVLAISFMEAPLKFRAPDVTLRIGLGIGRLIFRALNNVEAIFADTPEQIRTPNLLIRGLRLRGAARCRPVPSV
jgi:hypothetical protein